MASRLRHLLGWALYQAGVRERGLPASQMAAISMYGAGTTPAHEAPAPVDAGRARDRRSDCDAINHA